MNDQLLDLKAVCKTTSLSKSLIYKLIQSGEFPSAIRIPGTRRVAWRYKDILQTIERWSDNHSTK